MRHSTQAMDHIETPSLKDFITGNQALLSALAVLIAIATYVGDLPIRWLGNTLLFISIAAIVIVWIELYLSFPKHGPIRLVLFKNALMLGLVGVVLYWFLAFPAFWNIFLFVPLFGFLVYMSFSILQQLASFTVVQSLFGKQGHRRWWQRIIMGLYVVGVFYGISWLLCISIGASPGFNLILEMVRQAFH